MSALFDRLRKHSNEAFEIGDNAEARALLMEVGLIDKFSKQPPSTPWFEVVTYADHPTHWLIGMLFRGFAEAKDNGYVVRCYPRSQFSETQMDAILESLKQSVAPGGGTEKWISTRPTLN